MKPARKHLRLLLVVCGVLTVLLLMACAPKQGDQGTADGGAGSTDATAATKLVGWTPESDCKSCHVAEVASASDTACSYSLHSTTACTICHTDERGTLTAGHEKYADAKQPTKLKKSTVSPDICKSCHNIEEVKLVTAELTVLTDSYGTTVNPHDLPETSEHNKSINCTNCHKMHKSDPIAETAKAVCTGCHHKNVFECGTCHS